MSTPGPPFGAPDPATGPGAQPGEPRTWGHQPPGGWGHRSTAGPQQGWGPAEHSHPQQGWPPPHQAWHQPPDPGAPGPERPDWAPGPSWYPGPALQQPVGGRRPGLRWVLIAAAIVAVALVGVLGFWTPGFFVSTVFDQAALQDGIEQVLTGAYGHEVSAVHCAEDIPVTAGATFTCEATVDGERVTVPVTITSDDGHYQVGRV
ncbi:DUF4333 domain-containing protein [Pseudonocardia hispaniensis]|uniref:DUF4333 domain-containing protein n=1 Tax=Pseudonocardia hispaniensis TaxID=904933 RepID=A0ABW1J1R1_9PSEU